MCVSGFNFCGSLTLCTQLQRSTLRLCILRAFRLDPGFQLLRSIYSLDALRKLYPKHSVVTTSDYRLNLLNFPEAYKIPMEATPLVSELVFRPLAKNISPIPGVIAELVEFGVFHLAWQKYDFILYMVRCPVGSMGVYVTQTFLVHEGSEDPARSLFLAAGLWSDQLHNEIWVFNQGFWQKDYALWTEVQKADWRDVILKEEFKEAFKKDVYGFFTSEAIYKDLAIPWKRGIIMHGPPGNGKTISIKAIIKTCDAKGFTPLYVKSFKSYMGEEGSMAAVFNKARQLAPCVLILEDLDSLINDANRSFFLNQIDGLEGNDGLLVIGTTNHFDRLDPGLSSRPSRFDRKFLFGDPDQEERGLYAKYWQRKLQANKDVSFPDSLVNEVAAATDRFSFAYLKEAFVSSLVMLAGYEGEKTSFALILKGQIEALREQLDKSVQSCRATTEGPQTPLRDRDVRTLLDNLCEAIATSPSFSSRVLDHSVVERTDLCVPGRGIRRLLDTLSEFSGRQYQGTDQREGTDHRAILDRVLAHVAGEDRVYLG
ncbi:P-loop containing nucleoside triphosphate hydrolase protein [Guyanagaster necrorhizus]|uniref:P-loop containing nucleoside triphosphate hydrolase protein n=1 Tax=Guyanagaster necrorhizus TaxID=856835 RepID=A0A9P7VYD7_9AGAR|nr:P-loop containing nucleoside triphosphate hydrolase protein [Guyanagaster necrorhizus MCA 3950]KAG7449020.1 P-loop containing nucleoside triphosphate hydrolase protein [Guyanagaster necrorhizus MCA 3950]